MHILVPLQVVCRWLGIEGAEVNGGTVDLPSEYGQVPVWVQELKCKGTEASIADCPVAPADPQAAGCTYFRAICKPPGESSGLLCAAGSPQKPCVVATQRCTQQLGPQHPPNHLQPLLNDAPHLRMSAAGWDSSKLCNSPPPCHTGPGTCSGTQCSYPIVTPGPPCGGGFCNADGTCVEARTS